VSLSKGSGIRSAAKKNPAHLAQIFLQQQRQVIDGIDRPRAFVAILFLVVPRSVLVLRLHLSEACPGPPRGVALPGRLRSTGGAMSKVVTSALMRSVGARPNQADALGIWRTFLDTDPRQAIQEETIRCLICARTFRQLTNTHLRAHGIRASEYKRRFGYNPGRPLMCRKLQRLYTERAVRTGLAAKIRSRPILANPDLRRLGGVRRLSLEEMLTRRDARLRPRGAAIKL